MSTNTIRFLVIFIGGILFLPFLGAVPLFDWDEINFAESAREMIMSETTIVYVVAGNMYETIWH